MDQQFLRIAYGNEDKFEETDLIQFASSIAVATYLRKVAARIEVYSNSKKYRASEEQVLREND